MQHRMKTHLLEPERIAKLLQEAQTGCIATVNPDGTPYVTPIHFVYEEGMFYFHGLPKGQKIDNILNCPDVCLTIYRMDSLILDPDGRPCDTDTRYQSVIADGEAHILPDLEKKQKILNLIIQKYTPHLSGAVIPENKLRGTAIVEVKVKNLTGKYYG